MHSLETIHARNIEQVHKEMREALAEDSVSGYVRARKIALANPDLYVNDGRQRLRAILVDVDEAMVVHAEGDL